MPTDGHGYRLEILHARHQTRKRTTLTRSGDYTAFGYCAVTEDKKKKTSNLLFRVCLNFLVAMQKVRSYTVQKLKWITSLYQLVLFYILDFIISKNKVCEINCNRSRGKKTSLYLAPLLVYRYCISQTFGCKCL